jgi:hypothetical protein
VKVATDLEAARLFEPADLHRLKACSSDQPLDFVVTSVVVGHRTMSSGDRVLEDSKRSAGIVPNAMANRAPVGNQLATVSPDEWPSGRSRSTFPLASIPIGLLGDEDGLVTDRVGDLVD